MTEEHNGGYLDEREAFEAAMVEAGYDKPERSSHPNSGYLYQCDEDRFVGWDLHSSLSTSKQAGGEPVASREHDIALREGHQIRASEDYFCARSKDFHTINTVSAYEAGFKKGWEDRSDLAAPGAAIAAREQEIMGALKALLWAATERDARNRIRQFDEFVQNARTIIAKFSPEGVAK